MSYTIKAVFYTIQGEGYHAGTPAVFVRFAGCNLWSGKAEHRQVDAERNRVWCPLFCDTDFVGGERLEADDVGQLVASANPSGGTPLVVLTGGEPLLQVDGMLVAALRRAAPQAKIAIETNGATDWPEGLHSFDVDWVCVSPKLYPSEMKLRTGHELKVVYPAYDPGVYFDAVLADELTFKHLYVQPEAAPTNAEEVGESTLVPHRMLGAAEWCMVHPRWKLSVQTHKVVNLD